MKTVLVSVLAIMTLAACGKKEEVKPADTAPAVAASTPAVAPASASASGTK